MQVARAKAALDVHSHLPPHPRCTIFSPASIKTAFINNTMAQTYLASVDDLLAYLDRLNFFHMDLGLERMDRVLKEMGLARPPYFTIQVCGTNGKGSTATFLACILREHKVATGLYTSPHFYTPAERVQIDGEWTSLEDWVEPANRALSICPDLTYFELVTVIGLELFAQNNVACAILEAGLGAKYDATTATAADCVVLTPIALDHVRILGSTIAEIALEKSHAVRSGAPVITASQTPEAMEVIQKRARSFAAPLTKASPLPEHLCPGLAGAHQLENAATALAAFREIAKKLSLVPDEVAIARGLASAFIPGRLQLVKAKKESDGQSDWQGPRPAFLLDGAHNPHGMATLAKALKEGRVPMPACVVFSCLADKDWKSVLALLAPLLAHLPWHIPMLSGERAEKPETVQAHLSSLDVTNVTTYPDAKTCLASLARKYQEAPQHFPDSAPVLVTGSLYLLGDFFAVWPDTLKAPAQA